mmetsp:Transcript_16908/g.52122  ORF Transcript_16908/g.52122 Transcript_16908/m.52122 type:complete len:273 (-) Transcript_16908:2111-2929(-)
MSTTSHASVPWKRKAYTPRSARLTSTKTRWMSSGLDATMLAAETRKRSLSAPWCTASISHSEIHRRAPALISSGLRHSTPPARWARPRGRLISEAGKRGSSHLAPVSLQRSSAARRSSPSFFFCASLRPCPRRITSGHDSSAVGGGASMVGMGMSDSGSASPTAEGPARSRTRRSSSLMRASFLSRSCCTSRDVPPGALAVCWPGTADSCPPGGAWPGCVPALDSERAWRSAGTAGRGWLGAELTGAEPPPRAPRYTAPPPLTASAVISESA